MSNEDFVVFLKIKYSRAQPQKLIFRYSWYLFKEINIFQQIFFYTQQPDIKLLTK